MNALRFGWTRVRRGARHTWSAVAICAVLLLASFLSGVAAIPLGLVAAVAISDSADRRRVARQLAVEGAGRAAVVSRLACERALPALFASMIAAVVGVIGALVLGLVLSAAVGVVALFLFGYLVTVLVGELGRRLRPRPFRRRSVLRALVTCTIGALLIVWAAPGVTGIRTGTWLGPSILSIAFLCTISLLLILPNALRALAAVPGLVPSAVRPALRDTRRVRAALVVVIPALLFASLAAIFQPSFAAREQVRRHEGADIEAKLPSGLDPGEMWVTVGSAQGLFRVDPRATGGRRPDEPSGVPSTTQVTAALTAELARLRRDIKGAIPGAEFAEVRAAITPYEDRPKLEYDTFGVALATSAAAENYDWTAGRSQGGELVFGVPSVDVALADAAFLDALGVSAADLPAGGALTVAPEIVDPSGAIALHRNTLPFLASEAESLQAEVIEGREGISMLPAIIVDAETAAEFGYVPVPLGLLVKSDAPIPDALAEQLRGTVAVPGDPATGAAPATLEIRSWTKSRLADAASIPILSADDTKLDFVPDDRAQAWQEGAAGIALALLAILAVVIGWGLDRSGEFALLDQLGASILRRRVLAGLGPAIVVGVTSAVTVGLVMFLTVWGFHAYNQDPESILAIPWRAEPGLLVAIALGVPLLAGMLGALTVPSERVRGGLLGGPDAPLGSVP